MVSRNWCYLQVNKIISIGKSVSGFSKALKKAKHGGKTSILSDPFYRYAYKCRLVLDPNGYGMGENTHLSIFFFVMKSEYDAILSWPLNTTVTFRLIDQQEDANDRENIVKSLRIAKHLRCFARPMTDGPQRAWLNNICIAQKTKRKALYSERFYLNSGSTNPTTIAVIQSATKRRVLEKWPRLCFFGRIQEWILIWDSLDSLRDPPFPPKTKNKQTNKQTKKS